MAGGMPQNLLANLSVRLGMDTKAFNMGAKGASKNISSFKSSLGGIKALFGVAFGAMAIRQIQQFASEAKELYKIQASGEVKLETVMRQRMKASDEMIQSVKNLTREQQALGVIGDEVQLSGAQQLATFLRQKNALEALIPAMNNLIAQQKGYDAQAQDAVNVANMMGKVLDGQVGALRRVGITFTSTQEKMLKSGNEMERAATLAQVITDNVGNMNQELAKTDLGKLKQLENKLSDIKEKLGKELMPAFVAFANIKAWALGIDISDDKKPLSRMEAFNKRVASMAKDEIKELKILWERQSEEYQIMWIDAKNKGNEHDRKLYAEQKVRALEYLDVINKALENNFNEQKNQIPLLDKINGLIEDQTELWKSSVTKRELESRQQRLEQLKKEKKLLESIGSLSYYKNIEEKQGLKPLKGITAKVTPTTPEIIPGLMPAGLEPGNLDFSWYEVAADDLKRLNDEISQSFQDLAVNMTDAFLEMAVSGKGFQPGNLLLPIANIAENLGKLSISMGMATIAMKTSLKSLQGGVAIAAGIALVALAKMIKAKAASMASGVSVSTNIPTFQQGSNADRTSTRYYGQTARQEIHVTVDGEISGEVIRLANKRAELKHRLSS